MAIENLTRIDSAVASDLIPLSVSGSDRAITIANLTAYLQTVITASNEKTAQYAAPSATGFSVSITNTTANAWLVLTPVAGYAAGTIVLPSSTVAADKQEVLVNCTQAVTTLTVDGNGATVTGEPASLAANDSFLLKYEGVTNTWYKVG